MFWESAADFRGALSKSINNSTRSGRAGKKKLIFTTFIPARNKKWLTTFIPVNSHESRLKFQNFISRIFSRNCLVIQHKMLLFFAARVSEKARKMPNRDRARFLNRWCWLLNLSKQCSAIDKSFTVDFTRTEQRTRKRFFEKEKVCCWVRSFVWVWELSEKFKSHYREGLSELLRWRGFLDKTIAGCFKKLFLILIKSVASQNMRASVSKMTWKCTSVYPLWHWRYERQPRHWFWRQDLRPAPNLWYQKVQLTYKHEHPHRHSLNMLRNGVRGSILILQRRKM